jgi:hypothetical protein
MIGLWHILCQSGKQKKCQNVNDILTFSKKNMFF